MTRTIQTRLFGICLLSLLTLAGAAGLAGAAEEPLSRAFELRYVTADPAADGETDFKGPTAVFDTDQRVEYLSHWADYGAGFFNDPELNTRIVPDADVAAFVERLKPQPSPSVRRQIRINDWKFLGYREGQRQEEMARLERWREQAGVAVENGQAVVRNGSFEATFPEQPWRMRAEWRARSPRKPARISFALSDQVEVGFSETGRFFYVVRGEEILAGPYETGREYDFAVDLDLASGERESLPVMASTFQPGNPPEKALDGRVETAWYGSSGSYPQWIAFDLGGMREVDRVRLSFAHREDRSYDYRLESSVDGVTWERLAEAASSEPRWMEHRFDVRHFRHVRVYYAGASTGWASLGAIELDGPEGTINLGDAGAQVTDMARFNWFVDAKRVADFRPTSGVGPAGPVDRFVATAGEEPLYLDSVSVVSYGPHAAPEGPTRVREYPFLIETVLAENFSARPDPSGFEQPGYDDAAWDRVPYERYAHGGERHQEEALYLRRSVRIGDYERAVLNVETVRPRGELFINGKMVADLDRYPARLDVSDLLQPGRDNLIAIKVEPHDVEKAEFHMSVDTWSSWFAGLVELELTAPDHIDDVFAYATDVGDPANLRVDVEARSGKERGFEGALVARAYPWFPEESAAPAGEARRPIRIERGQSLSQVLDVSIERPLLWTVHSPHLYKVEVVLENEAGEPVDDFVLTTGLRTVSQEGGTFRINGRPEMLNGALLFGHHYPLERIAQWMFSPPVDRWVHDILLTKRMNGTALRMSVHDSIRSGINDRRLAQIGDQLGMMFLWQTPAWLREGRAEHLFDFDGLPLFARAVRNHPSIVVWQPTNHTNYGIEWFQQVYDTLAAVDQSRLISPSGDMSRMEARFDKRIGDTWRPADDDQTYPAWTGPLLARGTMEQILGYGQEWSSLRQLPGLHPRRGMELEVRTAYLNSPTHAWFDYESEETIGQPNWNLIRGKPYYHMQSYEAPYDHGSIGRVLNFDEWRESQAWQALSAYEGYRKKRWLGFDGMNWCPLRGGGNTATYMKPLLDYDNHAKLSYHAVGMVFQRLLAGSQNVDLVYGPGDEIPVIVMNLGPARTVDVRCLAKTLDGRVVAEEFFRGIDLPDGKGVVAPGNWKPELEPEEYYAFEYIVTEAK